MAGQGSFALGCFNLILQASLFYLCTPDSPSGVTSVPFWRRGPSALPGPPFSLTAQQLYLLPCPKEQRRCCVESPVPRWSQAGGGMTGLQHIQHIGAGSLRPARPLAVLSYRGGTRGLAVPLQIAAHCCWHSCKSWVGTAIPDATGEGKRRIIMAISHCSSLKSVSLGDGIFPR